MFNPSLDTAVGAGDHLIAMGQPQGLQKLEKLLDGSGK